ncbi:MAG: hypothetical protein QM783_02055 [Phycisphaerales bacterium]
MTPRPTRAEPPTRHPIVDEFTHRAAGKAAELVRHGAARAVHVVGDWCQKIVSELDATAAHLNGDPTPAQQQPVGEESPVVVGVPTEVSAVVQPPNQRAGPT